MFVYLENMDIDNMKKIPISKFLYNTSKALKELPLLITKRGEPFAVVRKFKNNACIVDFKDNGDIFIDNHTFEGEGGLECLNCGLKVTENMKSRINQKINESNNK